MSDALTQTSPEQAWRAVDARLAAGELDAGGAIKALGEAGLIRKANGYRLADGRSTVWMLEPDRDLLVPGPRMLLDMGRLYGGPRLYRPVRDLMLADTGAFAGPVPDEPPQPGEGGDARER